MQISILMTLANVVKQVAPVHGYPHWSVPDHLVNKDDEEAGMVHDVFKEIEQRSHGRVLFCPLSVSVNSVGYWGYSGKLKEAWHGRGIATNLLCLQVV